MKRLKQTLIIFFSLALFVAVGCKGNNSNQAEIKTTTNETTSAKGENDKKDEHAYETYVTLGDYKGIEISVDKSKYVVTDAEFKKEYDNIISAYGSINKKTEGTVKSGDTVNMDYTGLLDGVAFEGGTAKGASYVVGSGQFISDLDNGLKGITIGKEVDIPCTFPTNYHSADLAGKSVIFRVKVNYVEEKVTPVENDELAAKIAKENELTDKFNTIEGMKTYLRELMEEQKEKELNMAKFEAAFEKILKNCTIKDVPKDEYDEAISNIKTSIDNEYKMYQAYMGYTWEQYLQANNMTQDSYEKYCDESAKEYVNTKMVITLIGSNEGFTVTQEEVDELLKLYAEQYGYKSAEELMSSIPDEDKEKYKAEKEYEVMYNEVVELIVANCKEV